MNQLAKIAIILLFMTYALLAQSQVSTISGKVVDAKTSEPLPFAHVFIKGTQIGCTTNLFGNFKLSVSSDNQPDRLQVTSLSYKSSSFALKTRVNQGYLIELNQEIIQLDEVVVRPESAENLIIEAWSRIPHNYDTAAMVLHGYYKMTSVMDDKTARYAEAFLKIYKPDLNTIREKRKLRSDSIELRQMRSKPTEVKDWKVKTMIDWENNPYVLNHRDLVREFWVQKDSLDGFLSRFKVDLEKMVMMNGRRTYEININPKKENRKTFWYGSIYLDEETKAFVKLDFRPSPRLLKNMKSSFGYKLQSKLYNVFYDDGHFEESVRYEFIEGKWYFKEVRASKRFLISSKKRNMDKVPVYVDLYYSTDSVSRNTVQTKNIEILPYRSQGYWGIERFMEAQYDSIFWNKHDRNQGQKLATEESDWSVELQPREDFYVFTRLDTLQGALTPLRTNYDVNFYHLDVEILPEEEIIKGSSLIKFKVIVPTQRIQIDLFAEMNIEKIVWRGRILAFEREYNAVYVDFPEVLEKESIEEVKVYYSGRSVDYNPNIPMYASFLWLEDDNGDPWIQAICQGYGASGWWPNKDHLSDESDSAKISIAVPAGLDVVSNGQLTAKKILDNNRVRFDWAVSYPINNYNMTLNIGKYNQTKDNYGTLNLDYYMLEENQKDIAITTAIVKPMLKTYEKYFGPFPFPNDGFKIVESPHPMEHQSCVSIGSEYFHDADDSGIWSGLSVDEINYSIVLHESAHEWWGNSLSCRDNAELWIHEAFATYAEALFVEDHYGYEGSQRYLNRLKKDVLNKAPIIGKPNVNHIHYNIGDMYTKGALALNTLRHTIGDDGLWFSILRGLQKDYLHQSITTDEILAYINNATKSDYTYFFDQYLRTAALPKLEVTYEQKESKVYFKYRWLANVQDFNMPIEYATTDRDWKKLYPTDKWQQLEISNEHMNQVKINIEQFYVELVVK